MLNTFVPVCNWHANLLSKRCEPAISESAQLSRQRKKSHLETLEAQVQALEAERAALAQRMRELTEENERLKMKDSPDSVSDMPLMTLWTLPIFFLLIMHVCAIHSDLCPCVHILRTLVCWHVFVHLCEGCRSLGQIRTAVMTDVCKVPVYKPRITIVVSALLALPLQVEQIKYILVRFLKKLEEANCELG